MRKCNTSITVLAALAGLALAAGPCFAQPKKDYSADIVMTTDGKTVGTMKLYVSGLKSRNETGMTGGMIGICRRDKMLTWMLFPRKKVYTEKPLDAKYQSGEIGLDIPGVTRREKVGQEQVMGYACTKYKLTAPGPRAGRDITAYVWWADSLGTGLKSEIMGIVSEYRSLKFGPQPADLFELPAGYQKTETPPMDAVRMPKGLSPEGARKLQEAMRNGAPGK